MHEALNFSILDIIKQTVHEVLTEVMPQINTQAPQQSPVKAQDEKQLTTKEIAKILKVTKLTIFNWRNAGKIPFYKVGGRYYYRLSEVMEMRPVDEKGADNE